jgi:hypothetical protein
MARRTTPAKWQLHESTQRGLCRATFVFVGLVPLLCVLALCVAEFVPAYQRSRASAWSAWLSMRLGVEVQVAAIESQAPERFTLHGVRLVHPESHALLGRVRAVAVSRTGNLWSMQFVEPELDGRHLSSTWKMLHDWFMCRPQSSSPTLKLTSTDLKIRDVSREQALRNISLEVHPQLERTLISVQFQVPGEKSEAKPISLRISRLHSERSLATSVRLETGSSSLPCALISPLLPELKTLGEHTAIAGNISLHRRNNAWELSLENTYLAGIDFGQLTYGLEKRVVGNGMIWCQQAQVTDRGLQYVAGVLGIDRGRIDERWLTASQHYLGVALPREVQVAQVHTHSFEQLQLTFEITSQRLRFAGLVKSTTDGSRGLRPGTILADAAGELAIRASDEPIPLQNVIGLLSDSSGVTTAGAFVPSGFVPTGWLAQAAVRWLPLGTASSAAQPGAPSLDAAEDAPVRLSRNPQ